MALRSMYDPNFNRSLFCFSNQSNIANSHWKQVVLLRTLGAVVCIDRVGGWVVQCLLAWNGSSEEDH